MQNEVDNLNKTSFEDANVTYFVSGCIGRSICRRRKCTDCKILLLADSEKEEKIEEYIPKEYLSLFDDANRGGLSAPTELCYATTALAVQAYNAVLSESEIRSKLLASDNQRYIFTQALLRLASSSGAVLSKHCSQTHENLALIFQTAFNYCFAKNQLKRFKLQKIGATCKNATNCKEA